MSRKIVPVIGMHRSGTSALAGALHSGGVVMGAERHFRPRPLPENPKGFYEDRRFRRVNDLLCERSGYRIKSWDTPPSRVDDSLVLLARRVFLLLRRDLGASSWGWKDPRTCLTFDLWVSALRIAGRLDRTHAVFVVRDPRAVSDSLRRRNGLARERGLDLWTDYNSRALRSLESSGIPVSVVEFSRLLAEPLSVFEALATSLPDLDPAAGARFVDPRHARSSSDAREGSAEPGASDHPALRLFEELRSRAI